MNKLNEKKLNQINSSLLERQQLLWSEINRVLGDQGLSLPGDLRNQAHDRGDESIADVLSDIHIAAVTAEAQELKDIEQTFTRIRSGSYGICIDCGDPISLDRLDVFPVAKRCLDCQTKHENYRGGKDATPSL